MLKLAIPFVLLLTSFTSQANSDELVDALTDKADSGVVEARYHLGMLYNNGLGVDKSPQKAFELFAQAATEGDLLAHYKVGCYYAGQFGTFEGFSPNKEKALSHKLKAAEAGYSLAQYDVAAIYYRQGDKQKALEWSRRAAQQGDPGALMSLMALYQEPDSDFASGTLAYQTILKIKTLAPDNARVEEMRKSLESELEPQEVEQSKKQIADWQPEATELTEKATQGLNRAKEVAGLVSN
ncbi:tetratricopeptide repeat protein [Idiomarina ramblicola]|uniref:Sel1 repeat family protein n=1 Tax=Idiomarina ramblicola TaxID=263724 RepID=A0A432Z5M0_9GAMM|nr:tetratricopeptide repeat protein [Idiomarina ramblicola]RUO73186.1 hypothetical protein CWI78_01725 [Idiomarina ramblicola]